MAWSTVNFGKYEGKNKTLPQILFSDPDWFFWGVEKKVFKGSLAVQAKALNAMARNIHIPDNDSGDKAAEYFVHHPTGKFSHMAIVPADRPHHVGSSTTLRKDVIDLSVPRQIAAYDKLGCRSLISSVKHALFGSTSARMTKDRCEEFFNDPHNFDL